MTKGTHDNDEPTRWTSIGWQALLITNRLRNHAQLTEEQNPGESDKRPADNERGKQTDNRPESTPDADREYVEHRLNQLRAWERKLSGKR
jgi:hypothetical protein